jgi:hypothetical protein
MQTEENSKVQTPLWFWEVQPLPDAMPQLSLDKQGFIYQTWVTPVDKWLPFYF